MPSKTWTSDLHWVRPGQQTRSQRTQQALLDAAEELFAKQGVDATSVAEVAERAGTSIGAVYHHFRDKKALLYALYDRLAQSYEATTAEAVAPARWEGATIVDILHGYLTFALASERDRPGFKRVGLEASRIDPALGEHFDKLRSELNRGLTELILDRSDEIGHPDPKLATAFVLDQISAMLRIRLHGARAATQLGRRADKVFVAEALRSACAYLELDQPA
ncbi:MAG: helix-turn-helix domain-containing protein [Actinomycetota bacterium]